MEMTYSVPPSTVELKLSVLKAFGWRSTVSYVQNTLVRRQFCYILSLYFHIVNTNCKMIKISHISIYQKHNKTKLSFKSQDSNKYLQFQLIDYICLHFGFAVNSSFNHFSFTLI